MESTQNSEMWCRVTASKTNLVQIFCLPSKNENGPTCSEIMFELFKRQSTPATAEPTPVNPVFSKPGIQHSLPSQM